MHCNCCESTIQVIFELLILSKYEIKYYKCAKCNFIQTEEPYWLDEAYENSISKIDIGYCTRNIVFSNTCKTLIPLLFSTPYQQKYLDFGGGYGMFTRLMRDKGFDFNHFDIYTANLFSPSFQLSRFPNSSHYSLITSFEVFEHIGDPVKVLYSLLAQSEIVLISTELQPPNSSIDQLLSWRYLLPETGQHISLFHLKTLKVLAKKTNTHLYSNNKNLHLFSKTKYKFNPVKLSFWMNQLKDYILNRNFNNKKSLLTQDYFSLTNKSLKS